MNHAIRIYYPRPYKGAYVFVDGREVTHASAEVAFMIGWPIAKVHERASRVGFRTTIHLNMVKPRADWLTEKPKRISQCGMT